MEDSVGLVAEKERKGTCDLSASSERKMACDDF